MDDKDLGNFNDPRVIRHAYYQALKEQVLRESGLPPAVWRQLAAWGGSLASERVQ